MKLKFWFWVVFAISAVLFFTPLTIEEKTGFGLDKIAHLGIFAAMTAIGLKAYQKSAWVVAFLLAYTVATEFIQGNFIPHRSFDIYDMVADALGTVIGLFYERRPKI